VWVRFNHGAVGRLGDRIDGNVRRLVISAEPAKWSFQPTAMRMRLRLCAGESGAVVHDRIFRHRGRDRSRRPTS